MLTTLGLIGPHPDERCVGQVCHPNPRQLVHQPLPHSLFESTQACFLKSICSCSRGSLGCAAGSSSGSSWTEPAAACGDAGDDGESALATDTLCNILVESGPVIGTQLSVRGSGKPQVTGIFTSKVKQALHIEICKNGISAIIRSHLRSSAFELDAFHSINVG